MTTAAALRSRYAREAASTASPARLLTLLYDRLVRDLVLGCNALEAGEIERAHNELVHAQSIVIELRASLNLDLWDGARSLAELYDYLLQELIAANINKDWAKANACREIVEPLRDAWHEAADSLNAET